MSAAGEDGVLSVVEGQPACGAIQVSLTAEGDFGPPPPVGSLNLDVPVRVGAAPASR